MSVRNLQLQFPGSILTMFQFHFVRILSPWKPATLLFLETTVAASVHHCTFVPVPNFSSVPNLQRGSWKFCSMTAESVRNEF